MKKILSVLLAISLFASLAVAFAVPATAEENLCGYFRYFGRVYSDTISDAKNDNEAIKCDDLSIRYFGSITSSEYKGDKVEFGWYDSRTGTFTVADDGYDQRIPAAEFEELVKKTYLCGDDFAHQLKNGVNDYVKYDSKTDSYIIISYGAGGGGGGYEFRGYKKAASNTYSVYLQECEWDFGDDDEALEKLVNEGYITVGKPKVWWGTPGVGNDGPIVAEIDFAKGIVWYAEYYEMTVEYDGEYSKALSVKKIPAFPSAGEMITPEYTLDVRYDLDQSIKIDGGDVFPKGTVITAKGFEDYGKVAGSLKGIAKDGKIQAFEINATLSGAAVQPNGKVKVTIYLADYLTAENLKMYYIAEDGTREEIKITVTGRTVTAELEHFSTYALCNVTENAGGGAVNTGKSPKTGDSAAYIYLGIMAVSAAAVISASVISKRGRKENV